MRVLTSLSRPAAMIVALVLLSVAPASTAPGRVAPYWEGIYYYGQARQPVPFTLYINTVAGKLRGRIAEPATFGDGSALMLHADVRGTTDGRDIIFTKTYDGTGGQHQTVSYSGHLSADGRHMSGNWSLGGDSGAFTADVR